MSYRYWLHEKVQTDFKDGFAWYEDKLEGLGYEFLDAIERKIAEIVYHPETFGSKGNPNYREALLDRFPFVIVYKIYKRKKEIFISAVHHTKNSTKEIPSFVTLFCPEFATQDFIIFNHSLHIGSRPLRTAVHLLFNHTKDSGGR
jgi:ParE toxin of type II toxin-antitoxin system, parDE